ncbi:PAS domain-containing protein [Erythrobacter sp.]|uniref:PAS domain-containing protein n=1 Tax=Erythrobacter sp. TaxID=1042 RepID=UPI002EB7BC4A|nr:PAS-domain containing protein [Erythrobacter sp.]
MHLVAWNSRYKELFDLPEELVIVGRSIAELIRFNLARTDPPSDKIEQQIERRVEHMRAGSEHRIESEQHDGRVMRIVGSPTPGGGYTTSYTHITEDRRGEQALEEKVAQRTEQLSTADRALAEATRSKTAAGCIGAATKRHHGGARTDARTERSASGHHAGFADPSGRSCRTDRRRIASERRIQPGRTTFSYGGYVKLDAIRQRTSGGQLPNNSILRDFLIPVAIPVGGEASGFDTDFIGVTPGTVFDRQPLIRYTKGGLQLAVEQPETVVTTSTGSRLEAGDDQLPDFVARYNWGGDWGSLTVTGIVRQLHVLNDDLISVDDSALGYGLSIAGKLQVGGRDDFRFMATAGDGSGRYIGLNLVNDAAITADGKLEPIFTYSGFAAFRPKWSDALRSTIAGS